jgi:hypothetical protein
VSRESGRTRRTGEQRDQIERVGEQGEQS